MIDERNEKTEIGNKYTDDLVDNVIKDIRYAEDYFDTNVKPSILLRYKLLHSSVDYYKEKFPNLSEYTNFTTSDIKDAVEWMMPSFVEIFFGADKLVGIEGRTEDDNPEALDKLIEFQVKTLNDGYALLSQWFRDPLEAGLGVIKCKWVKRIEKRKEWQTISQEQMEMADADTMLDVKDNEDGTFDVRVEVEEVTKNQPVIENIQPGCWIYSPDKDIDGVSLFEAHRHYMFEDDLLRLEKEGYYKNVKDIEFSNAIGVDASTSIDEIADAIANFTGEQTPETSDDNDSGMSVNRRNKILVYECYGKYIVDGSGLEQHCEIHIAGKTILRKKINVYKRPLFFDCNAFDRSYLRWKEAIADVLQDIQDLRTALMRQIIINTAINNDRKVAVDKRQSQAISDIQEGSKMIRLDLQGNASIKDVLDFAPQHDLAGETFPLIEMLQGMSEQRTGVTRYNQGLDADSLNKTATGITKIMAASQQKLRMAARNIARGLVKFYRYLVELNQRNLDEEVIVRLTGEYYRIQPDDITGKYDVDIVSNIGLQDSQLTTQNLMLLFTQILPGMLQMGVASPLGIYTTAEKIVEEMGFTKPSEMIGMSKEEVQQTLQQADAMQQLPMMLAQLMKQAGIAPEVAAQVVQGLMQALNPPQEGEAEQVQPEQTQPEALQQ